MKSTEEKVIKLNNIDFDLEFIKNKIVIYPTDTIYGIGCYALNSKLVRRIREIKLREQKPFSVIADKNWIRENCELNHLVERYLKKFPGKYTIIFKLKNKTSISHEVNNWKDTIGVRIPKHKITKHLPIPFVTTSVNFAGEKPITRIEDLPKEIKNKADIIIDEGTLDGSPSTVIDLSGDKPVILRR